MKILYVEDELGKNIPKIIRVFRTFLGKKICKKLQEIENDDYPATADDILQIVDKSEMVKIVYSFPEALQIIVNDSQNYEYFIIDRNLSNIEYNLKEIQQIDPNFQDEFYDQFFEREGDYFLELLISKNFDVKNKFFFLTANSRDKLRNEDSIKNHIDFNRFRADNFIDKSHGEKLESLKNTLQNSEILNLIKENQRYLKILEKIDPHLKDTFVKLVQTKDVTNSEQITANLAAIRLIYSNLLSTFAEEQNATERCYNSKGSKQIIMRNVIYWIAQENPKTFQSNSIIKNFLYDIQEIASDFGDHRDYKKPGYQPTTNTVNALIYELKDLVIWFESIR